MIDAEKLWAEIQAMVVAHVPVEVAKAVVIGAAPCGCCPRISLAGQKTVVFFDLDRTAAEHVIKRLGAFIGRSLPQPSVN